MVDPHNNLVNDNELMTLLAEIDRIINVTHCRNILLAGDINCDFSKYTQQVKIIRDFVDNYLLAPDSRAFKKYYNEITPDIETTITIEKDGYVQEGVVLSIGIDFFWPST